MTDMEHINRATWRNPLSLREYRRLSGHINRGEAAAFSKALSRPGRKRVLDIGVGAGRTAELLAPIAESYIGIDYTAEMVAAARAAHPGIPFEHMDARDLSSFANGSFDLVVFSFNGIDSVDARGRARIMAEAARVLAPGGLFVFSTFHRGWKGFARPLPFARRILWTKNPVKLGLRIARFGLGYGEATVRRRLYARLEQRDGEHARLLHSAHDFGILVYATTPRQIDEQLVVAGFKPDPLLFGVDGEPIQSGSDLGEEEHFHVIAEKPHMQ